MNDEVSVPIMRVYQIFYFAPEDVEIDDMYIAKSSVEAIKKFIIANKGRYNVLCAVEMN